MWFMCKMEKGLEISTTICIFLSVLIILYHAPILVGPFQFLDSMLTLNARSMAI